MGRTVFWRTRHLRLLGSFGVLGMEMSQGRRNTVPAPQLGTILCGWENFLRKKSSCLTPLMG